MGPLTSLSPSAVLWVCEIIRGQTHHLLMYSLAFLMVSLWAGTGGSPQFVSLQKNSCVLDRTIQFSIKLCSLTCMLVVRNSPVTGKTGQDHSLKIRK